MATPTATTGVDNFDGTGPASGTTNTSSSNDEIRFTNQNQLQPGDTLNGGAGIDTLRLNTSINFTTAGTSGVNTGLRNLEIIWINGAHTATFRSDQFGAGLLADNLTLRGLTSSTQNIVINMVASAPVLNMFAWQFTNWTGGTDIIRVNGTAADERIVVSSQHTEFDGGGGSDTVDYSGWGGGFTLTLDGANWVDAIWASGLTDRFRNVENVLGSADADTITGDSQDNFLAGNGGNDILSGGAGNDTLDGGTGADTMTGGVGDDTFVVDNAGDVVIERATDAGIDLVLSSVTFDASGINQDGIENIILTGTAAINATGNAINNILVGNSASNVLTGNAGDDTLDGGAGADTMIGGTGSDTYFVDNLGDVVIDRATDAGTDLVFSSVSFAASGTDQDGIENITLTGTANINATGNALNNILVGNSGNNVLRGGNGTDTLTGGAGADIFFYDIFDASAAQWDVATDFSFADGDRIQFGETGPASFWAASRWLIRADNSSNAVLATTFNGFQQRLTLTGIARGDLDANDFIFDTSTTPRIVNGGNSADMIFGGLGNDIITGGNGTNILIGDAGDDTLTGGNDLDVLDGGTGADTMTGGFGDDTYYVDNVGDVVNESVANQGRDRVYTTISWNMGGSAAGVENGYLSGTDNIDLTGNDLDNVLSGNSGNNVLNGGIGSDALFGNGGNDTLNGGAGDDWLLGGAGADVFVFDAASGRDLLSDFNRFEDKIDVRAYGVDTAAEALAFASNHGSSLILNFGGGNQITIQNMQVAQLNDGMFVV